LSIQPSDLACAAHEHDRIADIYRHAGLVVVRGGIELALVEELGAALMRIIDARFRSFGTTRRSTTLDDAYLQLKAISPELSRDLIVAARETVQFYRILTSPTLSRLLGLVLPGEFQIVHDSCLMRIDGRDDGRNFEWHHDFPFNAMSRHAVTCWIPVTPVTAGMGTMKVVPGTHDRLRPVRVLRELAGQAFAGPKKIEMYQPDVEAWERDGVDLPDVHPGDVVMMHALTLHRSGRNVTDRARWIVNPRVSDLFDEEVVSRGWLVSRAKDSYVFTTIHPELVVNS
jgi:ectoine hydroxylase-related dioxygenase (phytanoyl-CoA dioxygenase family)